MPLKKLSILYVEDERDITEQMRNLLEDEVNALHIAHDGAAGLETFKAVDPDIVITDIYMPRLISSIPTIRRKKSLTAAGWVCI
jgi:CheY-like chemotaxis protein